MYANSPYHRVLSYQGEQPFTNAPATIVPKPTGKHPWAQWHATEGWSALLNERDQGLGLITPGRTNFTGGFAGKPGGKNDTHSNSTGYMASQAQEILDHNIVFETRYELLAGSLDEIRARAKQLRALALPRWDFAKDRQGWHYLNTVDQGWPIREQLQISLESKDPQLLSPPTFWQAAEAPLLIIEAAIKSTQKQSVIYFQPLNQSGMSAKTQVTFPIQRMVSFIAIRSNSMPIPITPAVWFDYVGIPLVPVQPRSG